VTGTGTGSATLAVAVAILLVKVWIEVFRNETHRDYCRRKLDQIEHAVNQLRRRMDREDRPR
jgi:hypothetical protein